MPSRAITATTIIITPSKRSGFTPEIGPKRACDMPPEQNDDEQKLRYPIGRFTAPGASRAGLRAQQIDVLALYAWHARHHTAHLSSLRERRGW